MYVPYPPWFIGCFFSVCVSSLKTHTQICLGPVFDTAWQKRKQANASSWRFHATLLCSLLPAPYSAHSLPPPTLLLTLQTCQLGTLELGAGTQSHTGMLTPPCNYINLHPLTVWFGRGQWGHGPCLLVLVQPVGILHLEDMARLDPVELLPLLLQLALELVLLQLHSSSLCRCPADPAFQLHNACLQGDHSPEVQGPYHRQR